MHIPPKLRENIESAYGSAGQQWLLDLPDRLESISQEMGITVGDTLLDLSYNYVAEALDKESGQELILKVGPPNKEQRTESAALQDFGGRGMVRLIRSSEDGQALLLERVKPGVSLEQTWRLEEDDAATRAIAGSIRALQGIKPSAPELYPAAADWAKGFQRIPALFPGALPNPLIKEAEAVMNELLAAPSTVQLIHGDLHHGNVLRSGRGWLAIDPKGLIAEAEYETGAMLRNPHALFRTDIDLKSVLQRRIDILHEELGFEKQKIRAYGFAQAVLSALWTAEDHGHLGEDAIHIAEALWQ